MRLLIPAVATVLYACGPVPAGEAQVSEICQALDPIDVPPAPARMEGTVQWRSPLALPPELTALPAGGELELSLLRAVLTAEGVKDLGFVEVMELRALASDGATSLASYRRKGPAPSEVVLAADEPVDLTALVEDGSVELETTLTGTFPTDSWTLLTRACYSARVAFSWPD